MPPLPPSLREPLLLTTLQIINCNPATRSLPINSLVFRNPRTQIIEYNPALIQRPPFQINVKTESPFLGDKLDVRLELLIEEVDENTCRQVLQVGRHMPNEPQIVFLIVGFQGFYRCKANMPSCGGLGLARCTCRASGVLALQG
jgi:hypothetical protein